MDRQLYELLESVCIPDGVPSTEGWTIKSLYEPRMGSSKTKNNKNKEWQINPSELTKFWKEYCNLVSSNPDGEYAIAEVPKKGESMPIIVDLKLKFSVDLEDMDEEFYDED